MPPPQVCTQFYGLCGCRQQLTQPVSHSQESLLSGEHLRIYVAELPAKFNYDLLYDSSRSECRHALLERLANPLGALAAQHDGAGLRWASWPSLTLLAM